MKAITLRQPFATLLIAGAKTIETRSWNTRHRGPIAIHASSRITVDDRALCGQPYFKEALASIGIHCWQDLPLGVVLGTCELVRTYEFGSEPPTFPERAFGDFTAGRYGWIMSRPRRFGKPIPARGRLGLWEVSVGDNLDRGPDVA